ncbi:DeoR/GlpR family DNA-binding transcription regulator [Octadecabacter sp. G9-8]|uniref:DeoR/GlpR family DNA-binding transcription regulator n=1 Tax=Octadecabacter dasysiphoniae TaxID=2909341 RepID=A0ABS9CWJ9_9RHOB|nr:DeoR/GlpR family DNA-binding transcription regulator [Octadecabacter dasysiphoniae]MCF2871528.1 DeoR/GlpR family DNA-binding transcription regulator [Octadecabacter dasysiphoniae]
MNFRHTEILDRARLHGKVTVQGLASAFGVTLQTIRRDLSDLADQGRLSRVHGGAVLPSGITNIGYEDRRRLNDAAKTRIGVMCAHEIKNGSSVFLGIGTTCEAVARALVHHEGLLVMTNNLNAVPILSANPNCKVLVTGGTVRAADSGLVGAQAASTARNLKFDLAVIGCSALDQSGDLFDYDLDEVIVSQTVIDNSRATALVADASKFERAAPARIAALSDLSFFMTDTAPTPLQPPANAAIPTIRVVNES